ncbi:30S ribosomal protein S3ae [Fervidicoccus fontis]|uniref:Small ribosomal subunit protein eS1 n=1 Tax=Fervidicoccus fontis TaxID=683846 RepID=A0A7C2ZQ46_9CREN|nr:30S ribosomal protein S3ae [Fervidicoccus fontis]HEW63552.1 30S ribosomal protein S3ae [Fervidicoccus fontis]
MSSVKGKRRELKETWKMKKWYEVIAPSVFGEVSIGSIPALTPEQLIGRTVEATLYDITGDYTQVHIKLNFQIIKVEGHNAHTRFKGHELARDYIKVLTRRKSSKVQGIFNVETKDGYKLRIIAITFTSYKANTSQKRAIRKIMEKIITERIKEKSFDEVIQLLVGNDLSTEIFSEAKKIYPIRKVEIYKSKLLFIPGPNGLEKATITSSIKANQ